MAPVPASLPSGPSWVSTLTFSIGDKKQIIVYTAILVSFIALFVIGLVYVLRVYNASSSEDEESRDTSTPRPPLRLLLPGNGAERAPSSASTLVTSSTPKTSPTSIKRTGSGPSPLVCALRIHFS